MTHFPDPDITLAVNLRNPGQFFACCGVLELASRLWSGSEGWFAGDEKLSTFQVATGSGHNDPLAAILGILIEDVPQATLAPDHERYAGDLQPIELRDPFKLRLDWWLDSYPSGDKSKSELKIWAGRQTPIGKFEDLRRGLRAMIANAGGSVSERVLSERWPMKGRFGFDSSAAPTALDVGFSADEQDIPVQTSPATELLAAIGLQRCRPVRDNKSRGRWFIYRAWTDPMDISVAPAAVAGVGRAVAESTFRVTMRSQQYGNFGWAKRWEQKR